MLIFKRNRSTAIFIRPTDTSISLLKRGFLLFRSPPAKARKHLPRNSIRHDAVTVLCIKANALLDFTPDDISLVAVSLQAREYHEEASWCREEPALCVYEGFSFAFLVGFFCWSFEFLSQSLLGKYFAEDCLQLFIYLSKTPNLFNLFFLFNLSELINY